MGSFPRRSAPHPARRGLFLAAAVLLVLPDASRAQARPTALPGGYRLESHPGLPERVEQLSNDGRYRLAIDRSASSALERSLIQTAERAYPPPASFERAERVHLANPRERPRVRRARARSGPRWWWLPAGEGWLPFAVTAHAVQSWVSMQRARATSPSGTDPGRHARLEYTATVTGDPSRGFDVRLTLRWDADDLDFVARRAVRFAPDGSVVSIEGDGPLEASDRAPSGPR